MLANQEDLAKIITIVSSSLLICELQLRPKSTKTELELTTARSHSRPPFFALCSRSQENGKTLADARGEIVYGASFVDW